MFLVMLATSRDDFVIQSCGTQEQAEAVADMLAADEAQREAALNAALDMHRRDYSPCSHLYVLRLGVVGRNPEFVPVDVVNLPEWEIN